MSLLYLGKESVRLTKDELWHRLSALGSIQVPGSLREREKSSVLQMEGPLTIWESLMKEYDREREEIEVYKQKHIKVEPDYSTPSGSVVEYMEDNVFSILFPALTKVLMEIVLTDNLTNTQSTFDPLDMIAQYMWNNNPKYPQRTEENLNIHDMPWAQEILKESPRPTFPKSWVYTPDVAAKTIQAFYRGYVVRRRADVQEIREFWRIIKKEAAEKVNK